jgi:hypothetical protein
VAKPQARELAFTVQQLETLSYGILSKDSKQWSVHFHLEDGVCEGKAIPLLWNNYAYFDESCLKDGKLHLFAHFEKLRHGQFEPHVPTMAPAALITETSRPVTQSGPFPAKIDYSSIPSHYELYQLKLSSSPKRKCSEIDLSSDSESDQSKETQDLFNLSGLGADYSPEEGGILPLPLNFTATKTKYKLDFETVISANAQPGIYGHKSNWDDIPKQYHGKVTHARLIKGKYGAPAPIPCDRCLRNGIKCRTYQPELRSLVPSPGACGECQLGNKHCTIGGLGQRARTLQSASVGTRPAKLPKTRTRMPKAPDQKLAKSTKPGIYCSVKTCFCHHEGFPREQNLDRHIHNIHSKSKDTRLEKYRIKGPIHHFSYKKDQAHLSARFPIAQVLPADATCTMKTFAGTYAGATQPQSMLRSAKL